MPSHAQGALAEVTVVDDQVGRLTFASEMARGIFWLLGYREGDVFPSAPTACGTYDLTCSGEPASWAEVARLAFEARRGNGAAVRPVTTAEYYAGAKGPVAPRPGHSTLDLYKIGATGFHPRDWREMLEEYVASLA